MLPLQHTPLYSAGSYPNHYWTEKRNTTEWTIFMAELVRSGNSLSLLMLEALAPSLPGAHIGKMREVERDMLELTRHRAGLFNSNGFFQDILDHPSNYLNGTAPINITGAVRACVYQEFESTSDTGACTIAQGSDRDSFLWWVVTDSPEFLSRFEHLLVQV